MKQLLALIVICLAAYGGYALWQQRSARPEPAMVATEEPAPTPAPTPAPAPEPAPAIPEVVETPPIVIPPEPTKRLSPAGVYYVVQPLSITTDSGVVGIRVGTGVRLIEEAGDTMKVTDGRNEFTAKRPQLSNDLDAVAAVCSTHAMAMTMNAQLSQQEERKAMAHESLKATAARDEQQAAQQRIYLRQIQNRHASIRAQEAKLRAELKQAVTEPSSSVSGFGPANSTTRSSASKRATIREQIDETVRERNRLEEEIERVSGGSPK